MDWSTIIMSHQLINNIINTLIHEWTYNAPQWLYVMVRFLKTNTRDLRAGTVNLFIFMHPYVHPKDVKMSIIFTQKKLRGTKSTSKAAKSAYLRFCLLSKFLKITKLFLPKLRTLSFPWKKQHLNIYTNSYIYLYQHKLKNNFRTIWMHCRCVKILIMLGLTQGKMVFMVQAKHTNIYGPQKTHIKYLNDSRISH